jgi:hypothetical protein
VAVAAGATVATAVAATLVAAPTSRNEARYGRPKWTVASVSAMN